MTPPSTSPDYRANKLTAYSMSGYSFAPLLRRALFSLLLGTLPLAGHARQPGDRGASTSLGVSVTVIDYCMNSMNARRPECAARLNSRIRESVEPAFVRNLDGSVRDDMPPGLYTVRVVDYF